MLFNSLFFICCFLPVVAFGFFGLSRASHHLAALWLCAASLFFYGWWNISYVWPLLTSVVFNYGAGYLIGRSNSSRGRLFPTIAMAAHLGLLGYYKYISFSLIRWTDYSASLVVWTYHPAARNFILHFHPDRLSGRCPPQKGAGI
jgi:D-alanyl-lipoteichoic acid acyltransferase DltB (MBOAT superfamily)